MRATLTTGSPGEIIGRISSRFSLTDLGRIRARECFEQCRYVGPAPVPLESYVKQCLKQSVSGMVCNVQALQEAFADLIIRPNLLEELGPAVCSGRSIFIYGPPGNGKTLVAKGLGRFLNKFGGEIYVPYAIMAENSIITIFDPMWHVPFEQLIIFSTNLAPKQLVDDAFLRHIRHKILIGPPHALQRDLSSLLEAT